MSVLEPTSLPAGPALHRRRLGLVYSGGLGFRLALAFIVLLVLVAVFAPLIAPHSPDQIHPLESLAGSSPEHPLGQDQAGRDILSRLIYGARLSLLGPCAVVALSILAGVPMGLIAGWRGGIVDTVVSRAADAVLAFPPLLLAIVIAATFGAGFTTAIVAIAITYVPLLARVTRGLVLVEREKSYVDAFRCQGFTASRILLRHVLPNCSRALTAQATLNFGYALMDLAGLAFLGLAVQPPTPDWGVMLAEGRSSMLVNPMEVIAASVMISLTVVAFNVAGNGLAAGAGDRE
jgi:peptide/nickel transport system permease protein